MLLQKRSNGIFYFRWVYPPVLRKLLGKRELIKSLKTTSKTQALARAGVYYMAVESHKDKLADLQNLVEPYAAMKADVATFIESQKESIAGTLAQMERQQLLERQRIGIERAKADGKYKGRKATNEKVIATARKLLAEGMTKEDVAKQLNIGVSTLYRLIKK